jgi:hypothetical protein
MPRNPEALLDVQRPDHARVHELLRRYEPLWTRIFEHFADDSRDDKDEAAPTTRDFCLTSQRGFETVAMTAWTESLMNSYAKHGGKCPMPSEKRRVRKISSDFDELTTRVRSIAMRAHRRCDLTSIIMFGAQASGNAEKLKGLAYEPWPSMT